MNSEKYFVKVCSSNLDKRDPEFRGILYEARDNPEEGELVLKSEELKNLNTIGGPICFEHDRKIGKIGVITNCSYEHPHYYVDGVVNTKNFKLKEQVRHMLKSGELGMLSIGFKAVYDKNTKKFSNKEFEEASLVRKGFYPTTKIVSVAASADKGQMSSDYEILDDDNEVFNFLRNVTNSNADINNNNYINEKDSESTNRNFIDKSITANKNNLQKQIAHKQTTMSSPESVEEQTPVSKTIEEQTLNNDLKTPDNNESEKQIDDDMKTDSETESAKTRQERENELLAAQEDQKKTHEDKLRALEQEMKSKDDELKRFRLMEKKQNDEYVKKYRPIVDEMVREHKNNGEVKLAKLVEQASKNMSQKDILIGMVRQYKDNKAKDQRIKDLEKKAKRLATPPQQSISVASSAASASAKKNVKSVAKKIEDQTLEEFLDSVCGNEEIVENNADKIKSKNSGGTGKVGKFANQSVVKPGEEDSEIQEVDSDAEIDLQDERAKKIQLMEKSMIEAITVNCSAESKRMIERKFQQAPMHFPGALNRVSPALGLEFAKVHYGIEIESN